MSETPARLFALSPEGAALARIVLECVDGDLTGLSGRVRDADRLVASIGDAIREAFLAREPVVAVMASGALIRILAPMLANKQAEPPVIAISEDGETVVPLLGGHHGANELARRIARHVGAHAAVTTAGDVRFGLALDEPPQGWVLANPENAKPVMAALLSGETAQLLGKAAWLRDAALPLDDNGKVRLIATDERTEPGLLDLVFHPRRHVLGMGCERGTDPAEAIGLAERALVEAGIAAGSLAAIASIDLKADEAAIHAVADHFGVPARFFQASDLEAERPRLVNPSEVVFAETGCHGVAEGAALALGGADADLILPKIKSKRVTAAISRAPAPVDPMSRGRSRGRLHVVGIGPGQEAWRSPEVSRMIGASTDLVGYSLYLDLIAEISRGKRRHDFDLGREEDRVRHAMELAGQGRDVALVCSGDAGIYAMATLVFELLDKGGLSYGAGRIDIAVSPGISALQAAAARAGAPLGHDFCTISLSDLLTPIADIRRRVRAAGEGDFVIAFYNPVSRKRRTQLAEARDELLKHRPADTPVILAANLGREGEIVRIVPLGDLDINDVDMLTVVVVGSSQSRVVTGGDGRQWVYTPRGYAGKAGSGMSAGEFAGSGEAAQ